VDGPNKYLGVFDGHGDNGHLISSFAMGAMVDYLKNSNRSELTFNLDQQEDEDIEKLMRKCFRYAQDKAKE
jgi:serine/threonine protein phosphatase PrpC